MPTYDYECARCGTMEIFQSIKADALTVCPECSSKRFRRLVSRGAGVIFKGDGFWETDYNRSSEYRSEASKDVGTSSPTTADKAPASSAESSSTAKTTAAGSSASAAPAPSPT